MVGIEISIKYKSIYIKFMRKFSIVFLNSTEGVLFILSLVEVPGLFLYKKRTPIKSMFKRRTNLNVFRGSVVAPLYCK